MDAAATLCQLGAHHAAVTAGAHGVALAEGDAGQVRWFPALKVQVVSAVGAGDSFLGGVLLELEAGGTVDWGAAVLRGSATASASCEQLRAGGVDPDRAAELLGQLRKLPTEPARRLS